MTKVSSITDNLVTLAAAQLSGYQRGAQAYIVEGNNALVLKKGFGIQIGPGRPTKRFLSNLISMSRDFTVWLSRQVTAGENNVASRIAIEKALLEDVYKLIKAVEADQSLSGTTMKTDYTADSGIEFVEVQGQFAAAYYRASVSFAFEYQEDLNAV